MKNELNAADTAWLKSLGFETDLIDSPSGTRLIGVLFGEGPEEDTWSEEASGIDRGFACVA